MESEKIKKIKKGLECCSKPICEDRCPYHSTRCMSELSKDILTLINELESENKRLQKDCADIANHYQEMGKFYYEEVEKNQQLKDRINELEEGIAKSMLGCEFLPECTNEKLKQFAERLKSKFDHSVSGIIYRVDSIDKKIHETLKEVLGEE